MPAALAEALPKEGPAAAVKLEELTEARRLGGSAAVPLTGRQLPRGAEQGAPRRRLAPPGAAHLLNVAIEVPRRAVVDDGPHAALVDAEAEGFGRDDDVDAAVKEALLHAPALGRVHLVPLARVGVGTGAVVRLDDLITELGAQITRELVSVLAPAHVDDGRRAVRTQQLHDAWGREVGKREREGARASVSQVTTARPEASELSQW